MDPLIGASIISSGAGLISGLAGASASRSSEDRAFNRTLKLQRMQNDYNRQMWNLQNEYNSPSHQMQLYKDAGINPAARDLGSNIGASEVTASDASVPMNSEYGNIISGIGESLGSGVARTVQALSAEAQIAKLRGDIKYQDLVNRDFENLLRSREKPVRQFDEFGNDTGIDADYYDVLRARDHLSLQNQGQDVNIKTEDLYQKRNEREVYEAIMPYLKRMPHAQLKSLLEDIKSKALNNTLLEGDVNLMKEYGISPNDDGYKSLIRIALRDPDSFNRIIDGLSMTVTITTNLIN